MVKITLASGTVVVAVTVDDFLATASTMEAMNEFYKIMTSKYNIKRLGTPKRYLGWHFHHGPAGSIAISKRLLIDETLQDGNRVNANGKHSQYPTDIDYHAPTEADTNLPDTTFKYKQIVGDLRNIVDCTRHDLTYVVGRMGVGLAEPTVRHWRILKSTLRYLARTRSYGLYFHKRPKDDSSLETCFKTREITASSDGDWANDKKDR